MTIHELLALTGLTGNDEIPVWDEEASGEPTKKITAQNFAAAIKTLASLLGTGDVVNDLTSTATDKPGSANMLKTLNDSMLKYGTPITFTVSIATAGDFTYQFSAQTAPTGYVLRGYMAYFNSYRGYVRGIGGTNYCYYSVLSPTNADVDITVTPVFTKQ